MKRELSRLRLDFLVTTLMVHTLLKEVHIQKIGNIVNVRFQIAASKGTGTGGTATVYNLPFTPVNTDNYRGSGVMGYYEGFTSDKPILILVEQNQTQFPFRHSGDATAQSIGAANMSATFRFYISITYQTA